MRIKRLWQWLLAVSGVLGSLFVIVDQADRIGGWVGRAKGTATEWAASAYYGFDSARRDAAVSAAEAYQANEVCVGTVDTADLDGDGYATDLIAKYTDVGTLNETDPPVTCEEYAKEGLFGFSHRERFLVAKGNDFSHEVIGSLAGFNAVRTMGGVVIGSYLETDFPTTTIYGYQGGKLAKLESFEHMLQYGSGDDEEVEAFDLIAHGKGVRVRAPRGLFDIQWSEEARGYSVTQLDWTAAIADNQDVLYVTRVEEGAAGSPVLMLNREKIAGLEEVGQTVTVSVPRLNRIVFDPMCPAHEGFKTIDNTLGAVEPDAATEDHIFDCVLQPDVIVKVRFETY